MVIAGVDADKLFTDSNWDCNKQHAKEPWGKTSRPEYLSWRNRLKNNIRTAGYQSSAEAGSL